MNVIIDYGIGNLQSVQRGFERIGSSALITKNPEDVERAERIVLPGVGSFDAAMENLEENGMLEILNQKVLNEKTPCLGICLGFQIMTNGSEEGNRNGLGWINGKSKRFNFSDIERRFSIPHIGWNEVVTKTKGFLLNGTPHGACFYFAHSFHVVCENPEAIVATTNYGMEFVSIVQQENIFGTQFHPEKSQENGLEVLRQFVAYLPNKSGGA